MPIVVPDSLPQCGDNDSTLVQSFPEDWIHTPFIMDLLAKKALQRLSLLQWQWLLVHLRRMPQCMLLRRERLAGAIRNVGQVCAHAAAYA